MYLSGDDTARFLDDIVHLDTQRAPRGIDLTADTIFRLTGAGKLDFGGSEFKPAAREKIEPELADPDDSYGWWHLPEGYYVVRFNEALRLPDDRTAVLQPLGRLLEIGVTHASRHIDQSTDVLEVLISVPSPGADLKENCRVSRVLVGTAK